MRRALEPVMPALRHAYGLNEDEIPDMPWSGLRHYVRQVTTTIGGADG